MRYYTNLYRDSDGRGFFDSTFRSSDLARENKTEKSASGQLEHVATVAIVVVSDAPGISHELVESALLNMAIPPDALRNQYLDEMLHGKSLQLQRESAKPAQTSIKYGEDYVIYPVPNQSPETGEWIVTVNIATERGTDRRIDQYSDEQNRFASRDEAIAQCFEFGRQIVDNQLSPDTTRFSEDGPS